MQRSACVRTIGHRHESAGASTATPPPAFTASASGSSHFAMSASVDAAMRCSRSSFSPRHRDAGRTAPSSMRELAPCAPETAHAPMHQSAATFRSGSYSCARARRGAGVGRGLVERPRAEGAPSRGSEARGGAPRSSR